MEKPSFVRSGGMVKLPIGFRFHPTDEELVVHYLKRKAFSFPLPASVIPEFDVFQTNPWDLPGRFGLQTLSPSGAIYFCDGKERRYFFSRMGFGNRCRRVGGCGFWKAIGKEIQILASGSNRAVGMRRSLGFFEGKLKTQWVMHEFRLLGSGTSPNSSTQEMGDWVVYRVFQKRTPKKKHGLNNKAQTIIDLVVEDSSDPGPPQPCSPSSSSSESSLVWA